MRSYFPKIAVNPSDDFYANCFLFIKKNESDVFLLLQDSVNKAKRKIQFSCLRIIKHGYKLVIEG